LFSDNYCHGRRFDLIGIGVRFKAITRRQLRFTKDNIVAKTQFVAKESGLSYCSYLTCSTSIDLFVAVVVVVAVA
jgi:hypothetical protein